MFIENRLGSNFEQRFNYLKDFSFDDINGIEMHGFNDASLKAYGRVTYLKFIFKDGNLVTTFLCSKTKIKPFEKNTSFRIDGVYFIVKSYSKLR